MKIDLKKKYSTKGGRRIAAIIDASKTHGTEFPLAVKFKNSSVVYWYDWKGRKIRSDVQKYSRWDLAEINI